VHPRFKLGLAWLPRPGVLPDTEEDFLGDILGFSCIAQHPAGETDHSGEVTAHEFGRSTLVACADTPDQFLVRVPHGWKANSEGRRAQPDGWFLNAVMSSTLCILPRRLPSVTCSSWSQLQRAVDYSCVR
jgi:hypothetical protein